jgi:hypothetical protein
MSLDDFFSALFKDKNFQQAFNKKIEKVEMTEAQFFGAEPSTCLEKAAIRWGYADSKTGNPGLSWDRVIKSNAGLKVAK